MKSSSSSGRARGTDGEEKFTVVDVTEILVHWYAGRSLSEVSDSLGVDRKRVAHPPSAAPRTGGRPPSQPHPAHRPGGSSDAAGTSTTLIGDMNEERPNPTARHNEPPHLLPPGRTGDASPVPARTRIPCGRRISVMGSRTRHRRVQVDRAGVAALTGASAATVDRWYLHRASTGFPDKADTDRDGRHWWWRTDITRFHTAHLAIRAAKFTHVDGSGNPDDLLTAPQAAEVLGYKNHRSLPDALLDHPDRAEDLPSGRLRRRWHRRTVWAFADGRPLRHSTGRPTGTGIGPRTPPPLRR